jgi:hypothetical protein
MLVVRQLTDVEKTDKVALYRLKKSLREHSDHHYCELVGSLEQFCGHLEMKACKARLALLGELIVVVDASSVLAARLGVSPCGFSLRCFVLVGCCRVVIVAYGLAAFPDVVHSLSTPPHPLLCLALTRAGLSKVSKALGNLQQAMQTMRRIYDVRRPP